MNPCEFYRISVFPWAVRRRSGGILLLFLSMLLGIAVPVASAKEEEEPPPAPVEIELQSHTPLEQNRKVSTKLSAVYYEGTEGEKSVPVIVIHDWEEKGTEYELLAEYLQSQGYAVILPDLRGHGGSTLMQTASGQSQKLTPRSVAPRDIITGDLEAVRKFLLKENNAKKLNISATCIIGVGTGAILAAYYASYDWSPKSPFHKSRELINNRLGKKDIKAIVLVSPERKSKDLKIDQLWNDREVGTSNVSTLILVGAKQDTEEKKNKRETREAKTAKNIYQRLKRNHTTSGEDPSKWTLFFKSLDTELNGKTLLTESDLGLGAREDIRAFMNMRLRDRLRDPVMAWKGEDERQVIDK